MARNETAPGTAGTPPRPTPETIVPVSNEAEAPRPATSEADAAPRATGKAAAGRPATRFASNRKRLALSVLGAVVGGFVIWKVGHHVVEGRYWVSTDDAYVKAETVTIAPRIAGNVVRVAVTDLQKVAAGDLLAEIDPGDGRLAVKAAEAKLATQDATLGRLDAQIVAARAAIDQAEANLAAVRADVDRTRADFDRAVALARANAGTQQQLDLARSNRDRTQANVAVAEAGLAGAQASLAVTEGQRREAAAARDELAVALDKAKRDLSFTEVRAPFTGTVGNKAVAPGMYVQPGTRLMALVPLDEVYVEANFKETQVASIRPGARARISVDGLGGRVVEGRVVGLSPATGAQFSLLPPENATGNFTKIVQRLPVRIAVPAEVAREGVLRAGLSVVADVDTRAE
jgi:membrane fusion protein (multidrug efflux system)